MYLNAVASWANSSSLYILICNGQNVLLQTHLQKKMFKEKPNTWNMDSAAILAKGYIRITLLITIIIITVIRIITAEPVVFVI